MNRYVMVSYGESGSQLAELLKPHRTRDDLVIARKWSATARRWTQRSPMELSIIIRNAGREDVKHVHANVPAFLLSRRLPWINPATHPMPNETLIR